MMYKRCHTVTTKLTNLRNLKTYELKALDCQLKATSAFIITGNSLPLYPSQGATVELWERKLRQLEIQNK